MNLYCLFPGQPLNMFKIGFKFFRRSEIHSFSIPGYMERVRCEVPSKTNNNNNWYYSTSSCVGEKKDSPDEAAASTGNCQKLVTTFLAVLIFALLRVLSIRVSPLILNEIYHAYYFHIIFISNNANVTAVIVKIKASTGEAHNFLTKPICFKQPFILRH